MLLIIIIMYMYNIIIIIYNFPNGPHTTEATGTHCLDYLTT